jgi:2,4-dienoyl-CoA reductase-like NADH-dependent reductase (Old Yellow Enzyme family)
VDSVRAISRIPLALQLSHAGRKASSRTPHAARRTPWDGSSLIAPADGGWVPHGPSAVAQEPDEPPPHAMTEADIRQCDRLVRTGRAPRPRDRV